MAKDDYGVIAYKVLAYYYACIKDGVNGNVTKAQELAGCNDLYFTAVIKDLTARGLLAGEVVYSWGEEVVFAELRITIDGTVYIEENSTMTKVRHALGKAFEVVTEAAVKSTALL